MNVDLVAPGSLGGKPHKKPVAPEQLAFVTVWNKLCTPLRSKVAGLIDGVAPSKMAIDTPPASG